MTYVVSVPVRFEGTEEEKNANYESHFFVTNFDGEMRCMNCDCRPSHAAAEYACGTEPPRETRVVN